MPDRSFSLHVIASSSSSPRYSARDQHLDHGSSRVLTKPRRPSAPSSRAPSTPPTNTPTNTSPSFTSWLFGRPNEGRNSSNSMHPWRKRIYFYDKDKPNYQFTNFAPFAVWYHGKRYPTSEHLYQAMKFETTRPDVAEHIRTCSDAPRIALAEARHYDEDVRPDWQDVKVKKMEQVLKFKFEQHSELLRQLLKTEDAELIERSTLDAFWGIGNDGKGRNELGKALMRLRDTISEQRNRERRRPR